MLSGMIAILSNTTHRASLSWPGIMVARDCQEIAFEVKAVGIAVVRTGGRGKEVVPSVVRGWWAWLVHQVCFSSASIL
jgi:hypothetical protein